MVETPSGYKYRGESMEPGLKICAVNIKTSLFQENSPVSHALIENFTPVFGSDIPVGEITVAPNTADDKLPPSIRLRVPDDIEERFVIIFHPVVSSGQIVARVIEALKLRGIAEDHIFLVSILTCPEAVVRFNKGFPSMKLITAALDSRLADDGVDIIPGIG